MENYPKPRNPIPPPPNVSVEALLPNARILAQRKSKRMNTQPGYDVKPGKRILIVADPQYELVVLNALQLAIREKGGIVDTMITNSNRGGLYGPGGFDGSLEAQRLRDYGPEALADTGFDPGQWFLELAKSQKYDLLIEGDGGPLPALTYGYEHLAWRTSENWLSEEIPFPPDVQDLIDRKVFEAIQSFEKVRITDPEGTDASFTNYKDDRWNYQSHQFGKPRFCIPEMEDAEGVIAGTSNHVGFYPNIKVHVKNGIVVKVEGGGMFGEIWRELLEKYSDIDMPKYIDRFGKERSAFPAFFCWWEIAIGTMVKAFRPVNGFGTAIGTVYERRKAGLVHNGFGASHDVVMSGELKKRGLPAGHLHVHNHFCTYEGVTSQGERKKLIDKGYLTVLDDPEVRILASRYGDPDKILAEAWIPAFPGINVPGNYMKDYGDNPIPWIKQELYDRMMKSLGYAI